MATEEPAFYGVRQTDTFEVRSYAPLIVAETVVEGDWSDASFKAFGASRATSLGATSSAPKSP